MNENQVLFKKQNHLFVGVVKIFSDAMAEMDIRIDIPMALQKMIDKIERSSGLLLVSHGSGQAARSLVVL